MLPLLPLLHEKQGKARPRLSRGASMPCARSRWLGRARNKTRPRAFRLRIMVCLCLPGRCRGHIRSPYWACPCRTTSSLRGAGGEGGGLGSEPALSLEPCHWPPQLFRQFPSNTNCALTDARQALQAARTGRVDGILTGGCSDGSGDRRKREQRMGTWNDIARRQPLTI